MVEPTIAPTEALLTPPREAAGHTVKTQAQAPAIGYVASLDGVRGVAVLLVLASHSLGIFGGMLGVDIFFVLSGFLITNLLLAERSSGASLAVFYWRRFLRLMPALAVLALVVFVSLPYLPGATSASCEVLAPLLGVANWTMPFGLECPKYMGHAWSLGIEEQFYLLWPVLLLATLRLGGRRAALVLAVVLAAACGLWRAYLSLQGVHITRIYWPFDTHCDGLLIGAAAALAQHGAGSGAFYRAARATWLPAVVALAAIVALARSHTPFFEGGYTVVAALATIVIVAASRPQSGMLDRLMGAAPLVHLGTLSYGFYLWHYPIAVLAAQWKISGALKFVAIGGVTLGLAYLSRRFIEVPVLKLRPLVETRPQLGWIVAGCSAAFVLVGVVIYMP